MQTLNWSSFVQCSSASEMYFVRRTFLNLPVWKQWTASMVWLALLSCSSVTLVVHRLRIFEISTSRSAGALLFLRVDEHLLSLVKGSRLCADWSAPLTTKAWTCEKSIEAHSCVFKYPLISHFTQRFWSCLFSRKLSTYFSLVTNLYKHSWNFLHIWFNQVYLLSQLSKVKHSSPNTFENMTLSLDHINGATGGLIRIFGTSHLLKNGNVLSILFWHAIYTVVVAHSKSIWFSFTSFVQRAHD